MANVFEHIEQEVQEKEQFIQQQSERIQSMHEMLNEFLIYQEVIKKANLIIHGKHLHSAGGSSMIERNESMNRVSLGTIEEEEKGEPGYNPIQDRRLSDLDEENSQIRDGKILE